MKAKVRDRYRSVMTALEKARKDMTSGKHGIMAIEPLRQAESAAGKLIFDMVMYKEGSDQDLQQLISHRVLLETFLATIDHQKMVMSRFNQEKSRAKMREKKKLLFEWLDKNIHKYKGKLEQCAEDAVEQIPGLGLKSGTVKKYIAEYRKEKGLSVGQAPTKSKKKRK
jgi:hypothetical protein